MAVMRMLATADTPISIPQIAAQFHQGKAIRGRVGNVIAALARLGHLASDDGERFSLQRG